MHPPHNFLEQMRPALRLGFLFIAITCLSACGGKQEKSTVRAAQPMQHFECVPERWAEPPPNIGETPPHDGPDSRDVDPFLTQPAPKKD